MNKQTASSSSSAKDVFSYLLMIIMLYVGVSFLITLLFQYINVQFPDYLDFYYTGSLDLIKASISALIIVWPVFLLMEWMISKDLKKDTQKAQVWIRKWMLHLTVFIAAVVIIVDLITLVNNFLGGELSIRFGLKVLAILIIAALVFGYELWELRRDVGEKTKLPRMSAIVSSVIILGAIIAGFFLVGSPTTQREIRMDQQRVSDLQEIQYSLFDQWTMKGELPETLDALSDPLFGFEAPVDPETGEVYTYTLIDDLSFELCATFTRVSSSESEVNNYRMVETPYSISKGSDDFWGHEAEYTCFTRTIDSDLYHTEVIK